MTLAERLEMTLLWELYCWECHNTGQKNEPAGGAEQSFLFSGLSRAISLGMPLNGEKNWHLMQSESFSGKL
jgi:hypothetical protein